MSAAAVPGAATVQGRPVYILSNVQSQAAGTNQQNSGNQASKPGGVAVVEPAAAPTPAVGPGTGADAARKGASVVQADSGAKGKTTRAAAAAAADTAQQPKATSAPSGNPKSAAAAPTQPQQHQVGASKHPQTQSSKQVTPQAPQDQSQSQSQQPTTQPVHKRRPASANDLALVFQDPEGQATGPKGYRDLSAQEINALKNTPAGKQLKELEAAASGKKVSAAAGGNSGQHVAMIKMARCSICRCESWYCSYISVMCFEAELCILINHIAQTSMNTFFLDEELPVCFCCNPGK